MRHGNAFRTCRFLFRPWIRTSLRVLHIRSHSRSHSSIHSFISSPIFLSSVHRLAIDPSLPPSVPSLLQLMTPPLHNPNASSLTYPSDPSACPNHANTWSDCGFAGITPESCEAKGCCWDPSSPRAWCYHRGVVARPYMSWTAKMKEIMRATWANNNGGAGAYVRRWPEGGRAHWTSLFLCAPRPSAPQYVIIDSPPLSSVRLKSRSGVQRRCPAHPALRLKSSARPALPNCNSLSSPTRWS